MKYIERLNEINEHRAYEMEQVERLRREQNFKERKALEAEIADKADLYGLRVMERYEVPDDADVSVEIGWAYEVQDPDALVGVIRSGTYLHVTVDDRVRFTRKFTHFDDDAAMADEFSQRCTFDTCDKWSGPIRHLGPGGADRIAFFLINGGWLCEEHNPKAPIRITLNGEPVEELEMTEFELEEVNTDPWANRHPSVSHFRDLFSYSHLPPHLAEISGEFAHVAEWLIKQVKDGPELAVALRRTLEAKDAAVRQAVIDSKADQGK